jgi:hypothetical protein
VVVAPEPAPSSSQSSAPITVTPPRSNATSGQSAQSFYTPAQLNKRRADANAAAKKREEQMAADVKRIVGEALTYVTNKMKSATNGDDVECPGFRLSVTNLSDELRDRCEEQLNDQLSEKDDTASWSVSLDDIQVKKSDVVEHEALITCSPGEKMIKAIHEPKLAEGRATFQRSILSRLADDVATAISDELRSRAEDPRTPLYGSPVTVGKLECDEDDWSSKTYGRVKLTLPDDRSARELGRIQQEWFIEALTKEVERRLSGFHVHIFSTYRGLEAQITARNGKR